MREFCLFSSNKKCDNCGECESCVYDNKKICDNCGKCMEEEGIDIRAIKIEEIAKTITENGILEEELSESEMDDDNIDDDNMEDFQSLEEEDFNPESSEEYEDAWDHIEYVEDIDSLVMEEDFSDEIFPGLRKVKRSI